MTKVTMRNSSSLPKNIILLLKIAYEFFFEEKRWKISSLSSVQCVNANRAYDALLLCTSYFTQVLIPKKPGDFYLFFFFCQERLEGERKSKKESTTKSWKT